MPNYVISQFQYISDMTKFKCVAVNPNTGYIDFNILLPMPETLHIQSPQAGELPEGFVFPDVKTFNLDSFLQRCVNQGVPVSLALADYNRQKFGFADWYDWRVNHWGTKWNAQGGPDRQDTGRASRISDSMVYTGGLVEGFGKACRFYTALC